MGVPKEAEKREVRIFEEMLVENVPNLTKYMKLHCPGSPRNSKKNSKEIHTKTHYNQFVQSQRGSESRKTEVICHIQGIINEINS